MNKVIITMLAIIVIIGASLTAILIFEPNHNKGDLVVKEDVQVAQEEILDDCTDEYEGMQEDTLKANAEIVKSENRESQEQYIIKNKEGIVTIYQINEDGTEMEIEETGISIEYLTENDKLNIENGITVNGKQELNQLIEDFE